MKLRFRHSEDLRDLRRLIPAGSRVLELGSRDTTLLPGLRPSIGLGVKAAWMDFPGGDAAPIDPAVSYITGDIESPELLKSLGDGFDFILVRDALNWLNDCEGFLDAVAGICTPRTRILFMSHGVMWRPILRIAQALGVTEVLPLQNVLSASNLESFAKLCQLERCFHETRQLMPFRLIFIGPLVNRLLAPLPLIRVFNLRWYATYRLSGPRPLGPSPSVSIIVPARNEAGNIVPLIERTPQIAERQELIFVEGASEDGTLEAMRAAKTGFPQLEIQVLEQPGRGKYDAVKHGFAAATGDILMILDADMTVPPEDLPRFYSAIASGEGEFVMGTRLVYPLEDESMRFLNILGNRLFSKLFSWILGQPITDTLCGTKVLSRENYERLAANRDYFGDFDPFGDFDLILGSARMQLTIVEVPIRYQSRTYGETQISRFRNGVTLARMVAFAYARFKIA